MRHMAARLKRVEYYTGPPEKQSESGDRLNVPASANESLRCRLKSGTVPGSVEHMTGAIHRDLCMVHFPLSKTCGYH